MDIVGYVVNGLVLVASFYAVKSLVGNELQTLLTKDTTAGV
jgi:hypothetical protein